MPSPPDAASPATVLYIKHMVCARGIRVVRRELLATSTLGIGLIARWLGYGSLAHFSGQFQWAAHCSPSAYRKLLRAEPAAIIVIPITNWIANPGREI